jgi:hypothetical protein
MVGDRPVRPPDKMGFFIVGRIPNVEQVIPYVYLINEDFRIELRKSVGRNQAGLYATDARDGGINNTKIG